VTEAILFTARELLVLALLVVIFGYAGLQLVRASRR
jgi:hypothetical protein